MSNDNAPFYMDELAIVFTLFSVAMLGLTITMYQNEPRKLQLATWLLVLLVTGLAMSLIAGVKIKGEYGWGDILRTFLIGGPLLLLGVMTALGAGSVHVTYQDIAFYTMIATTEEYFFRGGLFMLSAKMFSGKIGMVVSAFISSLLFAIYHTVAYGLNMTALIFPFIAGIYLCFMLYTTKRISMVIVVHALYNILVSAAIGGVMPFSA